MKRNFSTFQLFNLPTVLAAAVLAAATTAQAIDIELLKNGDASSMDGWVDPYPGYDSSRKFAIRSSGGVNWFASSNGECQLLQTVTLADYGFTESVIAANPTVTASVTTYAAWGSNICLVRVYELDEDGNTVYAHEIVSRAGQIIAEEEAVTDTIEFSLNASTRKLKYEMSGDDSKNWAGYYGPRFRNCSLSFSKAVSFTYVSAGTTLGTDDGAAPAVALRHGDDRFLGYFTEATGGDQIFDEDYERVANAGVLLSLPAETTLYAHWQPVTSAMEGGITRLVYRGVLSNFGEWTSGLTKDMAVKVYDSASSTTPLWSGDVEGVAINPDGSFEAVFGDDELAYAFASNDVTHVELTVGDALSPLAPRRSLASVASVNRALVAEGAASDIAIGTLGAKGLVAEKVVAGSLEATGTVRVEGGVAVEVKPFDIDLGRETTIWRGAGVSAWGDSACVATTNDVVAGQLLWTADREGVAVIHCSGASRSTLRIPATIQFVRPGDEVRAPTWDAGEVAVTIWSYKK